MLGDILMRQGLITEQQIAEALEVQKKEKRRIGEILIKLNMISEEDMLAALGTQLGIAYYTEKNANLFKPQTDKELEKRVPFDFAKKNCVLPVSRHGHSMMCAINDPLDLLLRSNLENISGCEISIILAPKNVIQNAVIEFYTKNLGGDTRTSMLSDAVESSYASNKGGEAPASDVKEKGTDTAELSLDKLIAKAGEAPVIKLVDLIIRQAIDERASDIHIEPFEDNISLRYRIDGKLYNIPPPAPHLHLAIVSRIKILAKLDIAEKRLPQDGAITAKLENRAVDLRVSTIPTVWGEKVVMRILDKGAIPLELSGLGFDSRQIEILRKALSAPYGLFFVTGPTGSGKSTTLYAAVNETIDPTKNVVTVEDPVEYKMDGINQVAVKPEIGLTFAVALKAFLRQDPDVIMVGEIRDLETASICVRAALTGHFVLSTLHTNDAASAITRLVDIGIPHYLLTPSLIVIMGQRLARRLCQKCKEPYEPVPGQHSGTEFKTDLIYRPVGCEACKGSGFKGRVVVAEVMLIDNDIRALISKGATHAEIKDAARRNGMSTIFESGLRLVEKGFTSYDEVCRISVDA
jgi:type IV pilus assembly protein PilB